MKIVRNTLLVLAIGASIANAGTLATVNGKKVTTEEANRFIKANNPQANFETAKDSDKKLIIDRLIEKKLFIEAAKKAGIEKDPQYLATLALAKDELLVNQWMKNQYDSTVISDSEAKEFYNKNKEKFVIPKKVHARHILLKKDETAAKAIIAELKDLKGDALKKKFIELAKSKSEGPSASKGGDLGFFVAGQMVAPFSKAAFATEKGKVTAEPVKTQFGYHVIYVEDVKDASTVPYEKAKKQIVAGLKQTQFKDMMEKSAKELKSKAKITLEGAKK